MKAHHFLTLITLMLLAISDFSMSGKSSRCIFKDVGDQCGPEFSQKKPTSDEIETITKWHNDIRQRAASGSETQTIGTLDPASNMMKMFWDPELAALAQRLADQCIFQHDLRECRKVDGGRFRVGQNIGAKYYFGTSPSEIDWVSALSVWHEDEVKKFDKKLVSNYSFGAWGHYSQIIWWNTRSIGCGATIYKQKKITFHLVVCNYGASGNFNGVKVYLKGQPCSECPEHTTCDSTYDALCAPKDLDNFTVTDKLPSDSTILW